MSNRTKIIGVIDKLVGSGPELETSGNDGKWRLGYELGLDSLDQVELEIELEKEFGITIPDGAFTDKSTVGDVVTYVEAKIAANNG